MIAVLTAALVTAVAIGINAWLLHHDATRDIVTPDPPRVVQNFVGALATRRPGIAEAQVSDEVKAELSRERLRSLASALRSRYGDFRFAGAEEERAGATSRVRATLKTGAGGEREMPFHLERDPSTQLWKIVGIR